MSDELDKLKANIEAMRRVTSIQHLVAEEEKLRPPGPNADNEEGSSPPAQPTPSKSPDADVS